MTLIRSKAAPNPLAGWTVDRSLISRVGHDLQRPESILAERDGTLWSADARGGVMQIRPDGSQALITQSVSNHFDLQGSSSDSLLYGTLPNGLAFDRDGNILISNFGTDRLELMTRGGETHILLDSIDGQAIGKVNFVMRDSRDRIWITVSTRINPWSDAICSNVSDGYIVLLDDKGPRIVADGICFTNEVKFDAKEEWLYIAETCGNHVSRMRVRDDGSLTDREVFGPSDLGTGLVDGITFDAYGNLWVAMVFSDRLIAITPEGDVLELLDDGDPVATARFEAEFATGKPVSIETLAATGGTIAPWLASITFGGPDLTTCYLGGLKATSIPCFRSPVAGLPLAHW
jgi:gluconolactonase